MNELGNSLMRVRERLHAEESILAVVVFWLQDHNLSPLPLHSTPYCERQITSLVHPRLYSPP